MGGWILRGRTSSPAPTRRCCRSRARGRAGLLVARAPTTIKHCWRAAPWCSGLTCHPVKVEIGGSNPLGVANHKIRLLRRILLRLGTAVRSCPPAGLLLRLLDARRF